MRNTSWILLEMNTHNDLGHVHVAELAGQKMRGWRPDGDAVFWLINPLTEFRAYPDEHQDNPPVDDGVQPIQAYQELREYIGELPVVAFDLEYIYDVVLCGELDLLVLPKIGMRGFCALRLLQRCLDPAPFKSYRLEVIAKHFGIDGLGFATSGQRVEVLTQVFSNFLGPEIEKKMLTSWEELVSFVNEEWYPSRISFGKFKDRQISEALADSAFYDWLVLLKSSSTYETARMGTWYLERVHSLRQNITTDQTGTTNCGQMVPFVDPELGVIRKLIDESRSRLAGLQASYTVEKNKVEQIQSTIFRNVRKHYQKRDRLKLIVGFRRQYIRVLRQKGEDEAEAVACDYQKAKAESDSHYEQAEKKAEQQKKLSPEDASELNTLWKKLVRLYHPDRFANQPELFDAYNRLTSVINKAREDGDINTLRDIVSDPSGFVLKQGWMLLDFNDSNEKAALYDLYESLQNEIRLILDQIKNLHESPDYELSVICEEDPTVLEDVINMQISNITNEIANLEMEADQLKTELSELTGEENQPIYD